MDHGSTRVGVNGARPSDPSSNLARCRLVMKKKFKNVKVTNYSLVTLTHWYFKAATLFLYLHLCFRSTSI